MWLPNKSIIDTCKSIHWNNLIFDDCIPKCTQRAAGQISESESRVILVIIQWVYLSVVIHPFIGYKGQRSSRQDPAASPSWHRARSPVYQVRLVAQLSGAMLIPWFGRLVGTQQTSPTSHSHLQAPIRLMCVSLETREEAGELRVNLTRLSQQPKPVVLKESAVNILHEVYI